MTCRNCDSVDWVCENHQDRPWGGVSDHADACECGAGAPCPVCCFEMANAHLLSVFGKLRASLEDAVGSMESCAKDMNADPPWRAWHEPGDGLESYRAVIADAQAIEARRAETTKIGSVEDESAVGNADAPNTDRGGNNG